MPGLQGNKKNASQENNADKTEVLAVSSKERQRQKRFENPQRLSSYGKKGAMARKPNLGYDSEDREMFGFHKTPRELKCSKVVVQAQLPHQSGGR